MTQAKKSFKYSDSGIVAVEFALILPVMLVIFLGIVETSRMVLFDKKLRSAAFQIADVVTQNEEVSRAMLTQYTNAIDQIMDPFEFTGTVIFSSVAAVNNSGKDAVDGDTDAEGIVDASSNILDASSSVTRGKTVREYEKAGCKHGTCVIWQRRTIGTATSKIGAPGGIATMPNRYDLLGTQNKIVVEVYASYEPVLEISRNFISAFVGSTFYAVATYTPRQESLLNEPT